MNVFQFVNYAYKKHGLFWQRKLPSHSALALIEKGTPDNVLKLDPLRYVPSKQMRL